MVHLVLQKDNSSEKNVLHQFHQLVHQFECSNYFRYGWIIRTCPSMSCAWCCT